MQKFEYTVKNEDGLHARPAGLLIKCTQECTSAVNILKGGKSADARRLFAVMGLGIKRNDKIQFTVEGSDENADCAKLKAFCMENI